MNRWVINADLVSSPHAQCLRGRLDLLTKLGLPPAGNANWGKCRRSLGYGFTAPGTAPERSACKRDENDPRGTGRRTRQLSKPPEMR
jgi:hypothetical protein